MNPSIVSVCHSLKIIPVSKLTHFARFRSLVVMKQEGAPDDAIAVPGSIMVSASMEEGILSKKIVFERAKLSKSSQDKLEAYKRSRLVAIYVDEVGDVRVCGSPSYPLTLEYTSSDGVYNVTLQGKDSRPDGYLAD